jgi:hypothetical protein
MANSDPNKIPDSALAVALGDCMTACFNAASPSPSDLAAYCIIFF